MVPISGVAHSKYPDPHGMCVGALVYRSPAQVESQSE